MVSQVLIYTIDQDVDDQEQTGTKKKIDQWRWGIGHGSHHCCISCASGHRATLRWAILDGFSSYGTRAMWRAHFAYLEVALVSDGGGDLSPSSLGDGVGGLRCTSRDGENTNRSGELRRSFLGGWLDVDGSTRVWRRLRWWLGFELGLEGENRSG
jgi:hypothetical protein